MPLWIPWFFFACACAVALITWDEARYNRQLWLSELKHNEELWRSKMRVIAQLDGRTAKLKRVRAQKLQKRGKRRG